MLYNGPNSTLHLANDDDDPPHSANSTPSLPDRHFSPSLLLEPSTDGAGASSPLVQVNTSVTVTDAVVDTDNHYGIGIASDDDLDRRTTVRNARQAWIILIALVMQLMFYGTLLTLLLVQTLHPGLLQI